MGLDAAASCLKYLMFAFNFIFWLLGCSVLGVGIWAVINPNFKMYLRNAHGLSHYLYTVAIVLIVIGAIIMFIGFVGCCGAIRESQCMLSVFFICLFIIFVALLSAGIWSIVSRERLKEMVTSSLIDSIKEYDNEDGKARSFMDTIQRNFHCCGANGGSSDYRLYASRAPPDTCIMRYYPQPCDERFFNFFAENIVTIAGVAIGIGLVMLFGMIFSLLLCCAIREADAYA